MVTSPHARTFAAWAIAVMIGAVHALADPFFMNADALSYMDLAQLYAEGRWQEAVNAYWSPFYPMVIGAAFRVFRPGDYWELPLVHAVGLAAYLLAFAAFRFFLESLRESQAARARALPDQRSIIDLRGTAESVCAHLVFHLSALAWIGLENLTPDMFVAAAAYVIAGLTIQARRKPGWAPYFAVGLAAGAGYLVKAVLFPVGIVFCIAAAIPFAKPRELAAKAGVALLAFSLVVAPQVIGVSRETGAPTYGAVGKLAYAWLVNKTPLRWTGRPAETGTPVHPIERIDRSLPAFEFTHPQKDFAYPFWAATAHWRQGIEANFNIHQQLDVTKRILAQYVEVFGFLVLALIALAAIGPVRPSGDYLCIILPSAAALVLYALVHAEPRLIGPWPVLLFFGTACSMSYSPWALRQARMLLVAVSALGVIGLFVESVEPITRSARVIRSGFGPHLQLDVAQHLAAAGVTPGERVATIEAAWDAYWARAADVQIAMEVVKREPWRATTDSARNTLLKKFRDLGAVAVVELRGAGEIPLPGWKPVAGTGYAYLILKREGEESPVRNLTWIR
jgi:hypothetical protein